MADYFKDSFEAANLIDVAPTMLLPTCSNGRVGKGGVAKRLDRFFMAEALAGLCGKYRCWSTSSGLSDHKLVILEIDPIVTKVSYPFKFNSAWLLCDKLCSMVRDKWRLLSEQRYSSATYALTTKLKLLRFKVLAWEKRTRAEKQARLCEIELQLNDLDCHVEAIFDAITKELRTNLEAEKFRLLAMEEEAWQLKRRAIWLNSGDRNTKFFQNFATIRKNTNAVWEIVDTRGLLLKDQLSIEKGVVDFFSGVYTQDVDAHLVEKLKVIEQFPRIFSMEQCAAIGAEVTLGEVLEVFKQSKKGKSPGLDGWSVEFFLHFFDLVGEELFNTIEETRRKGMVPKQLNSTYVTLIPKKDKPTSFNDYRSIAHCNLSYKVITKIISNRIKLFLDQGAL